MSTTIKVIKKCIVCGEAFEDITRPKNKKTCSRKCADEARKVRQRKQYRIENPKKPTQREVYYLNHLEYPFWSDERIGRNQFWNENVPYDNEKIEQISRARRLYEYYGGRKRRQESIEYDGDEKGFRGVSVQFTEQKETQKASEVTTYTLTPEELKKYRESKKK